VTHELLHRRHRASYKGESIQRKEGAELVEVDNATATATAHRERAGAGDGAALSDRANFESAFGADFSAVRVHRGGGAESQQALAYAQGNDVHLAENAPGPGSAAGDALMGHELAHVVQQRQGRVAGPQGKDSLVVQDTGLEHEADLAGQHVARGDAVQSHLHGATGSGAGGGAQLKGENQPIQRHGALEHKRMGDLGSDLETYRYDTADEKKSGHRSQNVGFTLTHGDICMLSGDLFDARTEHVIDGKSVPIEDNLFKLANTPSSKPGEQVGTQDEILWALYKENPMDPRFKLADKCSEPGAKVKQVGPMDYATLDGQAKGAQDKSYDVDANQPKFPLNVDPKSNPNFPKPLFSSEVKDKVKFRYLRLAAGNRDHFARPEGDKSKGAEDGAFHSAGGSYRALHESAIHKAHTDGLNGKGPSEAIALEAAAQHYLTDSFASGHLRTLTQSIKQHWDGIYPNFWENLKRFISHRVAIYINKHETTRATLVGSAAIIEDQVNDTLEGITANYPPIGFERLVAGSTHDADNHQGVQVVNDLGWTWTAFGDGMMKYKGKDEGEVNAIKAVHLGVEDIKNAATLPTMIANPEEAVRAMTPAPAKSGQANYGSEQIVPKVDTTRETTQQSGWKATSLDDLWDNPIRSVGETYGEDFVKSAAGGDIADQIQGMESEVPEKKEAVFHGIPLGDVHPRTAFHEEVVTPIMTKTRATLHKIIDLDVSDGHAFFNEDDAALEEMDRMDARDKKAQEKDPKHDAHNGVKHMTLEQRATFVKQIMGGVVSRVSEDEEERIQQIFETTPAPDRPRLYEMIEGHKWNGDYREGFLTNDDELYNSLSGGELHRVRELINEGL